ncbi:DUF1904 family protein [Paenibacillus arenilitoris]|uniref:DUF1904 family protein n=1 Tax=Paenibacillus arenilitoris TaxID=2772299 RepID=A0A927H4S9_9BACL|nr:DUF1904 family protein [Paenibacillus arenilitoris]MBD2867707.1 DUF1904 family protein [Paenibacillus arenilitoris]
MPHLLLRGVPAEKLQAVSGPLAEELAVVCGCGADNFTMSCMQADNVYGYEGDASFAFIEVGWFERGQEARGQFAETVTNCVRRLGVREVEIVFHAYREDSYYINGKPAG